MLSKLRDTGQVASRGKFMATNDYVRQMPLSQFCLNECSAIERKTMEETWKKSACVFKLRQTSE